MEVRQNKIPAVSIGMPVYNGEAFIREALDSLLAQTFTDFELIISDNASTDGTEMICREYASNDERIRYVRQPENRGATANFQFVLDEAVGAYFMWAAADDRRHPDFLRFALQVLSDDASVGVVFSGMIVKNLLSGDITASSSVGFNSTRRKPLKAFFRLTQMHSSIIYGLCRTHILRQIKLKNYDYFDFYVCLWFELNSNIRVIPLNLYTAGTNGTRIPYSLTGKFIDGKTYIEEANELFKQHLGFFPTFLLTSFNRYWITTRTKAFNHLIRSSDRHSAG
jgi:glycosyltransferase involved in cell wall biosynthesis